MCTCIPDKYSHTFKKCFLSIFQTKYLPCQSKQFLPLSLAAQSVETLSKWKNLLQKVAKKIK
jgi:hypothetical protein